MLAVCPVQTRWPGLSAERMSMGVWTHPEEKGEGDSWDQTVILRVKCTERLKTLTLGLSPPVASVRCSDTALAAYSAASWRSEVMLRP